MDFSSHTKFVLLVFVFVIADVASSTPSDDLQTYIIHMDTSAFPSPFSDHHNWYTSILSSLSSDIPPPVHLYTYRHVINGFSAALSGPHLAKLEKTPGHLATYPETFGRRHTTHTPKFLGLNRDTGLWPVSRFGDDVIIGIIDMGIWPESESFRDDGMTPVPARWRGKCENGPAFGPSLCNKKLIGGRSFSKGMKRAGLNVSKTDDYDSPRDFDGHGTHTSSIAAGSRVPSASYFGYGDGEAVGVAPKARLAMYKVAFLNETIDAAASDTLAGMDQAISDGVDLISLSLGFFDTTFDQNPIAIGAFAAIEKGIFVSCSVGNGGPHAYTITNGAPWITAVGAGTIDRELAARVTIDENALSVFGKSVYPENLFVSMVPIYFGHGNKSREICDSDSLNATEVAGKYIFCDFDPTGQNSVFSQLNEMYRTGAAGAIFSSDDGPFLKPTDFDTPFVVVNPKDGNLVREYLAKTKNPKVSITFELTILGTKPAPQVAYFSSRGPEKRAPWVLKPDILAPGVDILAAWVPNRAFAPIRDTYLLTDYALLSGTSMASPHIVGVAALLKATHSDWTPAMLRSAMMTTADIYDNRYVSIMDMTTGLAATPLDFGAGHVNPNKAMDPGLVYDIKADDYVNFLCGLNYTREQIKAITRRSEFSCDLATLDLNYPSYIVILNNTNITSYTFKRVLTSVSNSSSVYRVVVNVPKGMEVVVEPLTISFLGKGSVAEFNLTVKIDLGNSTNSDYIGNYGYLSWHEVDGKHVVTSPIVSAFAP